MWNEIIAVLVSIATRLSLRALLSREALSLYGGLLLLIGVLFGHVPIVLLSFACFYFAWREHMPLNPPNNQTPTQSQ